jgi:hypothetical protein
MACPSRNMAILLFAPILARKTAGRKDLWRRRVIAVSRILLLILVEWRFHG